MLHGRAAETKKRLARRRTNKRHESPRPLYAVAGPDVRGCSRSALPPWMLDPNADPASRAAQLLAEMTQEEKLAMVRGWPGPF